MHNNACIFTFGCQMNENDSEKIAGMLKAMDYTLCDEPDNADIVIFNTCCIRDSAEKKILGKLGALKGVKRNNPDMLIILCGCMAQKKDTVDILQKKYKHVDIIIGTRNLHMLPELIKEKISEKTYKRSKSIKIANSDYPIVEGTPLDRKDKYRAWVSITHGCNNFCTYCIVPYVRGRERSRKPEYIIREIQELADDGVKEITLLGQNVNSYGKDLISDGNDLISEYGATASFTSLLRAADKIDGILRIRFMTSHPKDLTDDLLYAMRDLPSVCEHLHLPIQSGSTAILKKMNRKYTKEYYLSIVEKARHILPGIAISTDIIVGFPGETDNDFNETMHAIEKVRFDNVFIFLYSKREGTPAAKMENHIDENIKKERFNRLTSLQNSISLEINKSLEGTNVEVLVEGYSVADEKVLTGRTRTNKTVNIKCDPNVLSIDEIKGKLVKVQITNAKTWTLNGKLII